ncbi:MAG: cyclic pyranopterin monophosphate synthase MoaC [Desulfuromonadales bacterium]|nr:cyclic pyranopterin monophosphate synthase MoaC [Desulfuromonadales bacterium]
MGEKLTHFDDKGRAIMVDVGNKHTTERVAVACGEVLMQSSTLSRILNCNMGKGDVLNVARVAGIMAAKKTPDLIPLCHPLLINSVQVEFTPDHERSRILIEATVKVAGQTGVEMEALTAVTVAGLTIYDMCKAVDRTMLLGNVRLMRKSGGRSGDFVRTNGECS